MPIKTKSTQITRHRTGHLPSFSKALEGPALAEANFDKITLHIKNAYIIPFDDINHFNEFKSSLCNNELLSQQLGPRSHFFEIKKGIGNDGSWLFGGTVKFVTSGANPTCRVELNLNLNPTRFLNFNLHTYWDGSTPVRARRFLRNLRNMTPESVIEKDPHITGVKKSLDRQHNIIPAMHYRSARPARAFTKIYLIKTLEYIENMLERALNEEWGIEIDAPLNEWSVSNCEVYWEYEVPDALSFVRSFADHIAPRMNEANFLEYNLSRNPDADHSGPTNGESRVGNSLCLKLNPGSKNTEYKIYAKDTNRVRFEIVYKSNLASILQISRSRRQTIRIDRYVIEGLPTMLQAAEVNAH